MSYRTGRPPLAVIAATPDGVRVMVARRTGGYVATSRAGLAAGPDLAWVLAHAAAMDDRDPWVAVTAARIRHAFDAGPSRAMTLGGTP